MIQVGVIGCGYWGPNLVRNFQESAATEMVAVSDLDSERLAQVRRQRPGLRVTTDYAEILSDPGIDAVAVATPVSSHFEIAMRALRAGKHVLVEKPLAANAEQAARLVEEADRRGLVLMVDHTFVYTGAIRKIRELIVGKELGDIYYYDSVRVNLGLFQHDVNVVWDLAVHDLAIVDYLLEAVPCAVSASGMSHFPGQHANTAYMTLFFDVPLVVHVNVNWLAPVKVRRTLVGGSRKMVVYDDLEPSEKIRVYDTGIAFSDSTANIHRMLIDYRVGDMLAPYVDRTEALKTEVAHFAHCVQEDRKPLTDGESGLRVVRVLEAATRSMAARGTPVELRSG